MKGYIKALILILVGFAVLLPFASTYPDGLETVAETLGVEENEPLWEGLMPDYMLPTIEHTYISTLLAGFFWNISCSGFIVCSWKGNIKK